MSKLCFGCMQQKDESPICEHCGFDERQENLSHQLPIGTMLQNQYLVGRVLGQGGFGITYLGWDQNLSIPVAIKEYFPNGIVQRHTELSTKVTCANGDSIEVFSKHRDRFLKEARSLAQLSDIPEIVHILSYFIENDTAYIVMEYVDGITLKDYLNQLGHPMTESEVLSIMEPVLKALQKVHDHSLIHRDISPDNIMLPKNGGIKLIDFGTVRYVDDSGKSKSTETVLKGGFAPMEQYNTRGNLGTWSDVYALCATFHYLLTGRRPEEAPARLDTGGKLELLRSRPDLSENFIQILEKGMEVRIADRIQTVKELYRFLYPEYILDKSELPIYPTTQRSNAYFKKRNIFLLIAFVLLLSYFFGLFIRKPAEDEPALQVTEPNFTHPSAAATEPEPVQPGVNEIEIRYQEAVALSQQGQHAQAAIAFGKLGNYRDSREQSFALWANVTERKTLVAHTFHTVGLCTDGTVLAAGRNDYGQCNVDDWTDIVAISASAYHTVGLKADGTVVAVGMNAHGQCDVSGWTDIVAILAEGEPFIEQNGEIPIGYTVGLKSDGTLITTGSNTYGQCDVSEWTDVINLTSDNVRYENSTSVHVVGLRVDGTVLIAGENTKNWSDSVSEWTDIVSVSINSQRIVGLKSDGTTIYTSTDQVRWGYDPTRYDASGWTDIVQIYNSLQHTIALRKDGTVIALGNDFLYDHSSVSHWKDIVSINVNNSYSVALKADGTVIGIGYDDQKQAKGFSGWHDIAAVYTSSIHTVGIKHDGTAVAAGFNEYGQCDISHWKNLIVPQYN